MFLNTHEGVKTLICMRTHTLICNHIYNHNFTYTSCDYNFLRSALFTLAFIEVSWICFGHSMSIFESSLRHLYIYIYIDGIVGILTSMTCKHDGPFGTKSL